MGIVEDLLHGPLDFAGCHEGGDLITVGCIEKDGHHHDDRPVSYTHLDVYKRQDGSPAADVALFYPQVIAADAAGDVYFADQVTYAIRKITAPVTPPNTAAAAPVFSLAAGTYPGAQTLTMTDATPGAEIYVTLNGSAPTTTDQGYHCLLYTSRCV